MKLITVHCVSITVHCDNALHSEQCNLHYGRIDPRQPKRITALSSKYPLLPPPPIPQQCIVNFNIHSSGTFSKFKCNSQIQTRVKSSSRSRWPTGLRGWRIMRSRCKRCRTSLSFEFEINRHLLTICIWEDAGERQVREQEDLPVQNNDADVKLFVRTKIQVKVDHSTCFMNESIKSIKKQKL